MYSLDKNAHKQCISYIYASPNNYATDPRWRPSCRYHSAAMRPFRELHLTFKRLTHPRADQKMARRQRPGGVRTVVKNTHISASENHWETALQCVRQQRSQSASTYDILTEKSWTWDTLPHRHAFSSTSSALHSAQILSKAQMWSPINTSSTVGLPSTRKYPYERIWYQFSYVNRPGDETREAGRLIGATAQSSRLNLTRGSQSVENSYAHKILRPPTARWCTRPAIASLIPLLCMRGFMQVKSDPSLHISKVGNAYEKNDLLKSTFCVMRSWFMEE